MATLLDDIVQSGGNDESNVQHAEDSNENLTPEMDKKIEALRHREEPVNILVIGQTGTGKSELINAMFGKELVEVGNNVGDGTTKIHPYEGEYKGIKIRVYNTIGFGDTDKSDHNILLDIAKHGKFDLILLCTRLDNRVDRSVDRSMLSSLATHLHADMWKRTVVVLTFANMFIELETVKHSGPEVAIRKKIDEYKAHIVGLLSGYGILIGMPFCIAGAEDERELPTTKDWVKTLWVTCIDRSSDETLPFLKVFAKYQRGIEIDVFGVVVGAVIGATVGSIVPVAGTIVGAAVGGYIGGVFSSVLKKF
uniref:Uncharacterized protein n=1 Tax=Amphimedon queenslandica TaxID=400682 RepID=A0A1X7TC28_AMPQE